MGLSGLDTRLLTRRSSNVANSTVQKAKPTARAIRSFKNPSLTTAIFILDPLDALRPGIVDPALVIRVQENGVQENGDYEERRQNANLAISIARKMNALIFLVPEDIVDVRPRLILTFIARLMSLAHYGASSVWCDICNAWDSSRKLRVQGTVNGEHVYSLKL
ncbi:Calponin homology domain containing protein [Tylopilus felleus]